MAGRKPKPTAIKIRAGNPGKRPLNNAEPEYREAGSLRAPRGVLPDDAAELWRVLAPMLSDAGVLRETDKTALTALCLHFWLVRRAAEAIRREGITVAVETASGVVMRRNPATAILAENSTALRSYLAEFGLTPSSRVRVRAAPAREKTLAELLFEEAEEAAE
jgi:P27 family predicted phage terminase small subunit